MNEEKQVYAENWSIEGAIEVIASIPYPGADTVFAPDFATVKSAKEFLSRLDPSEVAELTKLHLERRNTILPPHLNSSTRTLYLSWFGCSPRKGR